MSLVGLRSVFLIAMAGVCAADDNVFVYFGQGCFWHIQYEVIQWEKTVLGRDESSYTALAGYAGGTGPNSGGHACYPFRSGDGSLGHAEAVGVTIPKTKVKDFAVLYYSLFHGINRVDVMDRGPDYRAFIGIPGGIQSEYLQLFQDAQGVQKFQLKTGMGADADTLGQAWVWVYDSLTFPMYQAEVYHQFHDDFMPGGKYPQTYNDLRDKLFKDCRLHQTHCSGDEAFSRYSACPGMDPWPNTDKNTDTNTVTAIPLSTVGSGPQANGTQQSPQGSGTMTEGITGTSGMLGAATSGAGTSGSRGGSGELPTNKPMSSAASWSSEVSCLLVAVVSLMLS